MGKLIEFECEEVFMNLLSDDFDTLMTDGAQEDFSALADLYEFTVEPDEQAKFSEAWTMFVKSVKQLVKYKPQRWPK